jgi:hypothetical protein
MAKKAVQKSRMTLGSQRIEGSATLSKSERIKHNKEVVAANKKAADKAKALAEVEKKFA